MASDRGHLTGILLFVGAGLLFASADAMMKLALDHVPMAQAIMVRLIAFLVLAGAYGAVRGGILRAFHSRAPLLQLLRGVLLVIDTVIFTTVLSLLGLSETYAIYATTPLIATALAVPLLGESVGWRRWAAVGTGFIGALLIIRPGLGVVASAALLGIAGAACYALYVVLTRRLSPHDPIETSILYVALVGASATTPFGVTQWTSPGTTGILLLAGLSVTSLAAQVLVVGAYARTPATVLQPFGYLALAAATFIGFTAFDERLHPLTAAGTLIIVTSGLYVAWRERVSAREELR